MFVAIRDIRFAKGRFGLMGAVVALIALLIVLLSGLTAGLADGSTSAIKNLPATRIAFGASGDQAPEKSFTSSSVTGGQLDTWTHAAGVRWAEPLGIVQTQLETASGTTASTTVFGAPPGGHITPDAVARDTVVVSESLADDEGVRAGDTITIGGTDLTVAKVADDAHYSHTPVVWTSLQDWQQLNATRPGQAGSDDAPVATVIAADLGEVADPAAVDNDAGTVSTTTADSLSAIGSFSSENASLLTMQGFLFAISALVIGAFLTVWTIQRTGDIAILKALGGSTAYLMRDALVQALLVLVAGAGLGGTVGVGLGAAAAGVVPFVLTVTTTAAPVAAMLVLGVLGAVLAVRRITSVDPLTALGSVQ